jgi:hypothetical protein
MLTKKEQRGNFFIPKLSDFKFKTKKIWKLSDFIQQKLVWYGKKPPLAKKIL